MSDDVLAGAEEFSLPGGPVGALLVHGFTGSPQALRPLGEHLAARGVAVEGIRLPGHGTTWQDLDRRTSGEWVEAVDAGLDAVTARSERTFVVALSFGAALAIDLAARRPRDVDGLVTLAGLVYTKDPRRHLAPVIRRLVRSLPGVANDIADPDARELAYDRLPTAAAHAMLRFVRRARAALPAVQCPVLVMHGRHDRTVAPGNAEVIARSVSSRDVELVWLDRSRHVVTLDYDRAEVYDRTYRFIAARAPASPGAGPSTKGAARDAV
ncbi:MAG TPA: alpha/beta fold hydrolase [Actinomycetota bacterium]|nr:alpha/beta fold hydrolase [Actinomycetota bacterium]